MKHNDWYPVWLARVMGAALVLACIAGAIVSAPVPKPPEVKTLTPEMMVGTWDYAWSNWDNGVITLNTDGTYYAQHVPGSDTAYAGTWRVENGNTVTITEYGYHLSTGERYSGPVDYAFEFAAKDYPALAGLSNRSVKVALKNPKR